MFASLIFLLSFFQYESPRYWVKCGQLENAISNLSKIRGLVPDDEYVLRELCAIKATHEAEREATAGSGAIGVIKEAILIPSDFFRVYLTLMAHALSQWSGANSITIYASGLSKLLGITGNNESLLLVSAIFGIIKFVSAIVCALF